MSLTPNDYNLTENMQPNSYIIDSALKDHPSRNRGFQPGPTHEFHPELQKLLRAITFSTLKKTATPLESSKPNELETQ